MKNKTKTLLLAILSTLSLASCNEEVASSISSDSPIHGVDEAEQHPQEGTLHEVNVKDSNIEFVKDGKSDYEIIYNGNASFIEKAVGMVSNHINSATGCYIPSRKYDSSITYDASKKYIVFDVDELSSAANVTKTDKELGQSGYQITSKDNSVFILVSDIYGYQQAAICFLRQVIGYNRYSSNIVTYSKSGETLPFMDIVERPDFTFSTQSNKVDIQVGYEMGFLTSSEVFYSDSKIHNFHNSFDYVDPTEYIGQYPNWFSNIGEQLCYTAHGVKEDYDKMVDLVATKMEANLEKNPTVGALTFTIQDNSDFCTCDECNRYAAKYGTNSASVVMFMNDVDDKVQAYLEEKANETNTKKREVNLLFFAYMKTEKPPVKKDAKGNYVPTSEDVICNDHVGVYIAPITVSYTHSLYDETNLSYAESIKGWGALSNKLYMWLYETNFSNYLYPFNSYGVTLDSYRFCYENNAMYMYNEGQHNQGNVTAFGKFKEYFNSVTKFDVNASYNDIVDDFFSSYFKEASVPMKTMFKEIQEQSAYVESKYSTDLNGTIYNDIAQSRFWPKKLLDRWVGLINEAYNLVEKYKSTDRVLYESLIFNIKLESIFPRFALLNHYSGRYSAETLATLRSEFKADCNSLNVSYLNENTTMESLFTSWGI